MVAALPSESDRPQHQAQTVTALALTPELESQIALLMARAHVPMPLREDAKQAVYLALVVAWERFDPSRGRFNTYAEWKIRGAIYDWMRREDPLTRAARKQVKRGDLPNPDAGLSLDDIARIRPTLDRTPEDLAICHEVREWLDLLTDRQRYVIQAHYFEERTFADIAQALGLHLSRTHQICREAIHQLRVCLDIDRPKTLTAAA